MDLNPQRWDVKWFFWSLDIWDAFLERRTGSYVQCYGTNLCFFLRVMLVWTPLVLLLHTVVYGVAIAALTIVPIYLFGGSGYFWGVSAIVTLVLIILGVKKLRDYLEKRRWQMTLREANREANVSAEPSFFKILSEWSVAQKKKICPTITFSRQEEV